MIGLAAMRRRNRGAGRCRAVPDLVDQPARGTLRVGQALTQRPPGIHRGGALVDPAVLAASLHCAVDVPPAGGRLCSFLSYVPTASADPGRAADVDHMRTTSIPSNHGTFTKHLHIRRQSTRPGWLAGIVG